MAKREVEVFKAYCQSIMKRFFPSVRGAVLLIVIPAFFIVPVYFLTVVKEIIVDKRFGPGVSYEDRFAVVRKDLPAHAPVNFVSDHPDKSVDYLYVRYALVPARIVRGLKPMHDQAYRYRRPRGGARYQLLFPLVRVNFELGVIMVIAVSCVKLLSAHNSTQHTSRKHKV